MRKRPVISLNCSAFIENLSSSERARANHAKNDAQKGCAMTLKGITLRAHYSVSLRARAHLHAKKKMMRRKHAQCN